jgi:hypothetical protein
LLFEGNVRKPSSLVIVAAALALLTDPAGAGVSPVALPRPTQPDAPISTPAQGWALAASAMLTEGNGDRHDLLGGATATDSTIQRSTDLLKASWGITNRSDLLVTLKWLDEEGHRKRFEHLGAKLVALSVEEKQALMDLRRQDETLDGRVKVLEQHFQRLGTKSLLGWDLSRYIALCRWGYLVGYLSEAEAWALIMPAAQRLQHTFASWKDLGENYLIGRQFWSPDESRENGHLYQEAYRRLLGSPESPWNRYPWSTKLAPAVSENSR